MRHHDRVLAWMNGRRGINLSVGWSQNWWIASGVMEPIGDSQFWGSRMYSTSWRTGVQFSLLGSSSRAWGVAFSRNTRTATRWRSR